MDVIVITFCSPNRLGQETEGTFCSSNQTATSLTNGGGLTLSLFIEEGQAGSNEYQFLWFLIRSNGESNQSLPFQQQTLYPLDY